MTVSVNIEVARRPQAVLAPSDAVHEPGGAWPWVLRVESGRARRAGIQVGASSGGWTEVIAGLQPGDRLLPASIVLRDGERVRLRDAAP